MLREYQQRSIDLIYDWFRSNDKGNVCAVLPTGSGKSHIVAALTKDAVQAWPDTRVLMLTHQKELIAQNSEKLLEHWPNAPMGIYSASLNRRQVDTITFAGIQTVAGKAHQLGHVDLILIDECHLVNHSAQGAYRKLIADLTEINPALRVIGLSATPWRLGHGFIHEGDGTLFDAIIEPVQIKELIELGFLSPLRSKFTDTKIDTSGVKKRGGEFIPGDLERAVDTDESVKAIVAETMRRADGCKSIIVFCTGIKHAQHMADEFNAQGWGSDTLNGGTPQAKRRDMIASFKSKRLRVLTNVDVLTTGFDAPDIDCVVMARPTMSPVLYVQMAGRGMRLKSHTDHCLVLDFAGNVSQHGPITSVRPPRKAGKGGGEAPVKACPQCGEAVHASVKVCPDCGFLFPIVALDTTVRLYNDDIMGDGSKEMQIKSWLWRVHKSRKSGLESFRITYYKSIAKGEDEYLNVNHPAAGHKAMATLAEMTRRCGCSLSQCATMQSVADLMNGQAPPAQIVYKKNGKFSDIVDRIWSAEHEA
jgi:DNA repair protein RadD